MSIPTAKQIKTTLQSLADNTRAEASARFFKTGKGQYGEGDVFLGIRVPAQREVAKKFKDLPLPEIKKLLQSRVHEHRLTGLEILVMQYEQLAKNNKKQTLSPSPLPPVIDSEAKTRGVEGRVKGKNKYQETRNNNLETIIYFYLKNTKHVNNWDLVDTSAPYILGNFLATQLKNSKKADLQILYKLAKSKNLWERRISIVATLTLISQGHLTTSLELAKQLLKDEHDLIHKAVGWVLREVGKKEEKSLLDFLDTHATSMPRTALRYAIERLPKKLYYHYLKM